MNNFRQGIPEPTPVGDRFQCPNCNRTYASRLDGNVNAFYYRHFIRDHANLLVNRQPEGNIENNANNDGAREDEEGTEQALMEDYEEMRSYTSEVGRQLRSAKYYGSVALNLLALYEVFSYAFTAHNSHGLALTWNIVGTIVYLTIFLLATLLWYIENHNEQATSCFYCRDYCIDGTANPPLAGQDIV